MLAGDRGIAYRGELMPPPPRRPLSSTEIALDTLNLSPALLALAERAAPRRYRKGVLLIQEGEIGDTLYIVLSGRVKVFSLGSNDREITFGLYGPGEFVGEMSLDGGPRAASVITTEATRWTCVLPSPSKNALKAKVVAMEVIPRSRQRE